MSGERRFSLAGLLRFRQLQQDLAAGDLAAARARADANTAAQERARVALGGSSTDITDTATLYAVAAGRASLRSTLSDLDALETTITDDVTAASARYAEARAAALALEKLEERHAREVTAEALRAEQSVLDELATTTWHRDNEGTTP